MKRSISLDLFKIVLSIIIIAVHIQPLFETRNLLEWQIGAGLARLPVPCFFIINAYFLASKIRDWTAVKKYLSHLLVIYLVWSAFYFYFYYEASSLKTIFFNIVMGYHHLWYLPALLWGVLILYFARKYIKNDWQLFVLAVLLYLVGHVDEVSQVIPNLLLAQGAEQTVIPEIYTYRNGLFMTFPFLAIGYFMKKFNLHEFFKSWQLLAIAGVALCTLMIESYTGFATRELHDLNLSALLFGPAMILFFVKHPLLVNKSTWTEYLGYIPNGVYYIHVFFIFKFYSVDNNIYNIPIVFVSSVLATVVLTFVNKRIKIFL